MEALATEKQEHVASLTNVHYWDSRYKEEEHTEWLLDSQKLGKLVEAAASSRWGKEARILHLGCGTSLLPEHLYKLGYKGVANIDNSPVCISTMEQRFPHLTFELMDLNDLQYGGQTFDMVVEKSTLDTLISDCSQGRAEGKILVERGLHEVRRVLRPGGVLLSVSLLSPSEHSKILSPLGGEVRLERIRGGEDQVDCTVATVSLKEVNSGDDGSFVMQETIDDCAVYDLSDDGKESFGEEDGLSEEYKDLVKSMIS